MRSWGEMGLGLVECGTGEHFDDLACRDGNGEVLRGVLVDDRDQCLAAGLARA